MGALSKDWDRHVTQAEEVARQPGFLDLRDRIVAQAAPVPGDQVVDVGAGTGLLTLKIAEQAEQLWALDISPAMCEYLRAKAASAGLTNIHAAVASAVSLPLIDGVADAVVSNYCFHHLTDDEKRQALREAHRVLRPGGRLAFGDMMFRPALTDARDRRVVSTKVQALLRKGPGGVLRLAKNGARFASAQWERPARPGWWERALFDTGFVEIAVVPLEHEGGIASARKPA